MLITKRVKSKLRKSIALFMLFTLLNQMFAPSVALALTAGPTAPEATNFEPVDTTDMVNPLTGSFTYNMPLIEVPGPEGSYPLSLSYHAGIQPNEEASWVGLGWSLNPGAIARNVNGYPDDWSNASGLTRSVWSGGSTETISGGVSIGYGPASVGLGLSFSQDTYKGFGVGADINGGYGIPNSPFSIGVTIGVSPYGEGYAAAGLNYSAGVSGINGLALTTSIGVQTNFKTVSAGFTENISERIGSSSLSSLGASIGTSNMKPSLSVGGGEITSANNANANHVSTSSSGLSLLIPIGYINIRLGYNYTRYWSNNPQSFAANGVLNNRSSITGPSDLYNSDDDNYQLLDPINSNIVDNPDPRQQLGGTFPDFDNYSVAAQGLGGNIRPYIFQTVLYNQEKVINDGGSNLGDYDFAISLPVNGTINSKWQFRFINDFSNSYLQGHPWTADQTNSPQSGDFDATPPGATYGYDPNTNRLEGTNHIEYFTNDEIADPSPTSKAHKRGFIDCDAAGFTRGTTLHPGTINGSTNPTIGSQIGGFMITNSSGVTYHYALPAYSSNEWQRVENEVAANITNTSNTLSWAYTDLAKNEAYAYTWYLTAITGPDYVSRGSIKGKLDPSDWGYWVKFDYGKWTDSYMWRNPSEGVNDDPASTGGTVYSSGLKELYYLDAVETRTHTAIFEKEIRADGKSCTEMDETNRYQPQALYYPQNTNGTYVHPRAVLRLNNIYLFQNDQLPMSINALRQNGTAYNQSFTYGGNVENVHYGQNIIDINDLSSTLTSNCLRKIAFNYDYTTAMGCPNSYDPGGLNTYIQNPSTSPPTASSLLGKLTLLSVDFRGKGGALETPPTKFQYDLDPTDPANQDNISITRLQSIDPQTSQITPAVIQLQSYKSRIGDILKFSIGGVDYYCTILSETYGTNSFSVCFLNNAPTALASNIPAVFTKNPPYNKDAFDNWGYYKGDYGIGQRLYQFTGSSGAGGIAGPGSNLPIIKLRSTTSISSESTDVWSLRKIYSGIGATINIDYEGNTYNKSVLSRGKPMIIDGINVHAIAPQNYTFYVNSLGVDLNEAYKVGDVVHMVFIAEHFTSSGRTFTSGSSDSYSTPATITGVNPAGWNISDPFSQSQQLTIQVDPQMESDMVSGAQTNFLYANLSTNSNIFRGGGIRVKDIIVDDLSGNKKQTSYNYGMPGISSSQISSSGVTSYEPLIFDMTGLSDLQYNVVLNNAANGSHDDPTNAIKAYRRALYADNSKILSISREAPGPGVMYEYVTVNESTIPANGTPVPIDGKTLYQYEVFKPEMLGIYDYNDEGTVAANYYGPAMDNPGLKSGSFYGHQAEIQYQSKKDRAIKDYTSRIGNLKRIVTYDNLGNKLTEKINHYLHDDLDNTSFQNQMTNYEPRLAANASNPYNAVSYNNIGVIKERYASAHLVVAPDDGHGHPGLTVQKSITTLSNKETFPAIQTGTTQIDYKNGTRIDQTNLAYDFYTGAVTQTLTTDSYGNRFMSQATPAYMAGGISSPTYPALGLKTYDDDDAVGGIQHKQMLTQQASNYTFTLDVNNNPIGVVTASIQTWANDISTLDPDGNLLVGNINTNGQPGIWRMKANYKWLPSGSSSNNVMPYSSFVDYFLPGSQFISPGSSNPSWKKTGEVTKYNVYSAALEATDINSNYAATRMGFNNTKVLLSGGPARYDEMAYAGAEDAKLGTGLFSNNVSPGDGTVVADSTLAHTGISSLKVNANSSRNAGGYTYTLNNAKKQNYSVMVWVKAPAGNEANASQAELYYQVNSATAVAPVQTLVKNAAGWYLLEMTVPAGALSDDGSSTLVAGCRNASSGDLYFDDFRFQPTSASTTAYVYDTQTGELTYILGNNNLFVRYQYDAIGRLVRTYKEVLGKRNIPIAKSIVYNYGRNSIANWENTGNTRCQQVNGYNNGYLDAEQKDVSSNSPTYNQTRWVATTNTSASCPNQLVTFTLTNNTTTSGFTAVFSGITTPYSFPAPGQSITVQVPVGSYSVYIGPVGSNTYTFKYGFETQSDVHYATFSDVIASITGGNATTLTVQ